MNMVTVTIPQRHADALANWADKQADVSKRNQFKGMSSEELKDLAFMLRWGQPAPANVNSGAFQYVELHP